MSFAPELENDIELPTLSVGRGTYVDATTQLKTFCTERIIIGRYCSIADHVVIMAGGSHNIDLVSTWPFDNFLGGKQNPTRTYLAKGNTVIGSDVWIGLGAYVGPGASVGHGAVVGAKAVIASRVPPYAIVVGNPARILRYRFSPSVIEALLRIAWWEWTPADVRERQEWFYQPVEIFIREFNH